jgi:hypothetical protein
MPKAMAWSLNAASGHTAQLHSSCRVVGPIQVWVAVTNARSQWPRRLAGPGHLVKAYSVVVTGYCNAMGVRCAYDMLNRCMAHYPYIPDGQFFLSRLRAREVLEALYAALERLGCVVATGVWTVELTCARYAMLKDHRGPQVQVLRSAGKAASAAGAGAATTAEARDDRRAARDKAQHPERRALVVLGHQLALLRDRLGCAAPLHASDAAGGKRSCQKATGKHD